MHTKKLILLLCFVVGVSIGACSQTVSNATELKKFPIDNLDGIISKSEVQFDEKISSDGKGSLKIIATEPKVINLYEVRDIDIENALLLYQARVRTEDINGKVYLEMWCHFPGKGEFFSKGLQSPLTGTTDWKTVETPFILQKGQKPDYVTLNLVIDGTGTAWIDDISLTKGPLK
jgi:hypothetical protein